jgi:hypothetical protein
MNHTNLIAQLKANLQTFQGLFSIPDEQVQWKPSPEKWSMIEIVNHLYDEEREDFRCRLRSTLETPEKEWQRYDPSNFHTERNYAARDYDESVANFIHERNESILWLNSLHDPDWKQCYVHPKAGPLSAEFLLTNWLAHDYHHIRQINTLHYEYLKTQTSPTPLDYAGTW